MKRIVTYMALALMLIGILQPVTHVPEVPEAHAQTKVLAESRREETKLTNVEAKPVVQAVPEAPVAPPAPKDDPTIVWEYFISKGFAPHQVAGIMGNLQQEHNFQTTDVPGGLGIAQWLSGRRANLLARENPYSLQTQLDFIMWELTETPEKKTMEPLKASATVEEATIVFQNGYERCGKCAQSQRITYAYNWLRRFAP